MSWSGPDRRPGPTERIYAPGQKVRTMSLRKVVETVRGREKTLTVYTSPGTNIVPELRDHTPNATELIRSRTR